jgi:uncharacterized protein (DUF1501 family)
MTQTPASASAAATCCEEYERVTALSRRRFLGGMAAAGAAAVSTSVFGDAFRQASFGATRGGNVMVVLSFRGGVDGLGMVVPHAEDAYYAARRTIAVPKAQLLAKDATFGLHPHLQPLKWLWDSGEMAAVHAVGLEVPNRSHFVATELVEDAGVGSAERQGWVNRMVGLDADVDAVEAVHLGDATPPTLVEGPSPTVATGSLADIRLSGAENGWGPRRRKHLTMMWRNAGGPLGTAAQSALATTATLGPIGQKAYKPSVSYPRAWPATGLSDALQSTAQLIKADVGTEVVSVDFGSWDFHDGYGTLDWGSQQSMTKAFADALNAFMRDLGALRSKVTVVTISEFGRRVAENGNRGLDHGWGNMMLVLGGGVKGGRYYGTWPGLGTAGQVDGDLKVTTDYRQILGEIVHRRFPDKDVTKVFPGIGYRPLGVLSGS